MGMQKAVVTLALVGSMGVAHAEGPRPTLLHAELDPLTFANQPGYGGQIGVRHPALGGVRLAIASFMIHQPDAITDLSGNDGWDVQVRPSGAIYGLYYLRAPLENGFAFGASIRFLRFRLEHDARSGNLQFGEISPEVIAAYQWHPFGNGFYVQPWIALGVTAWRSADALSLDSTTTYEPLPVSPFFTVNLGYEHAL